MSFLVKCPSCIFCDCLFRECNCIIFPSSKSEYSLEQSIHLDEGLVWDFRTFNSVSNPKM